MRNLLHKQLINLSFIDNIPYLYFRLPNNSQNQYVDRKNSQ